LKPASAAFMQDAVAFAVLPRLCRALPPEPSYQAPGRTSLITAPIGTPHAVFDAAFKRPIALFLKAEAGTDVALAGLFALLAGFVSASLLVRQVLRGSINVRIILMGVPIRVVIIPFLFRRCLLHRNQ